MTAPRRGLFVAPFDGLADPRVTADLARRAESAGWAGVFVWDHVRYRPPVRVVGDAWIHCAAIAGATGRVRFGPMVTPLPRRRVRTVAGQAAALAQLSGGRFVLGFGIGGDDYGEFSRFGDEPDPRRRGELLDAGLEALAAMLSGGDGSMVPPTAAPIPIWIAGRYPNRAPARRAARFDGYFPISLPSPDALAAVRADLGAGPGFDLVLEVPAGAPARPWTDAGASWVLTTLGPGADPDTARAVVDAGP